MFELLFLAAIIVLVVLVIFLLYRLNALQNAFSDLRFRKGSLSVKYGKLTEQWIPLSEKFPYPKENFRFLGNPIDGLSFEEGKIVFCEFKTNTSSLSEKQKRIKQLVQEKKVEWLEMKIQE